MHGVDDICLSLYLHDSYEAMILSYDESKPRETSYFLDFHKTRLVVGRVSTVSIEWGTSNDFFPTFRPLNCPQIDEKWLIHLTLACLAVKIYEYRESMEESWTRRQSHSTTFCVEVVRLTADWVFFWRIIQAHFFCKDPGIWPGWIVETPKNSFPRSKRQWEPT